MKIKFKNNYLIYNETKDSSILNSLENQGFSPKYMCRDGFCHECKMHLTKGTVIHSNTAILPKGTEFLPCCSKPIGDIEIEEIEYL